MCAIKYYKDIWKQVSDISSPLSGMAFKQVIWIYKVDEQMNKTILSGKPLAC